MKKFGHVFVSPYQPKEGFVTLHRISEDEYEILLNHKVIGRVYPSWQRSGGRCWQVASAGKPRWFPTRREAIRILIKENENN